MDTVIQRLRTQDGDQNEFYMKRDDLLPFSMGGNKVRIAQAFLADMKAQGKDYLIMYGSRHSNLCRVLSDLCKSCHVDCAMICSHEDGEETSGTCNTYLIEWTDTPVYHCRKDEISWTVEQAMTDARACGKNPYYIYGNKYGEGNEGTAASAYADAYREIKSFERRQGWEFDHLFCPCGTGATQTGLICGHLLAQDAKRIIGVLISSREKERAYRVAEAGIRSYFEKCRRELPADYLKEIHITDKYRLGGYGDYDGEVEECIRREYCANGVPLDPIYTGKAFLGMKKYLLENGITGKRILFLHTGGTPLFYDYLIKSEAN